MTAQRRCGQLLAIWFVFGYKIMQRSGFLHYAKWSRVGNAALFKKITHRSFFGELQVCIWFAFGADCRRDVFSKLLRYEFAH